MQEGDRVQLVRPLGPFRPGAQGRVEAVDSQGALTVFIDEASDGTPVSMLLPPRPREFFAPVGGTPAPEDGTPAG